MAKDSQAAKVAPDAPSVPMLVEEKSADVGGIPVPVGMPVIGKVVHWEGTPTFTDAAALLEEFGGGSLQQCGGGLDRVMYSRSSTCPGVGRPRHVDDLPYA